MAEDINCVVTEMVFPIGSTVRVKEALGLKGTERTGAVTGYDGGGARDKK